MVNLERKRLSAEFLVRLSDSRTANRNAAESTHSVIILEPHSPALSALVTEPRLLARYESSSINTARIHIIISEYKVECNGTTAVQGRLGKQSEERGRTSYCVPLHSSSSSSNVSSGWLLFLRDLSRLLDCPAYCRKATRGKSRTRRRQGIRALWSHSRKEYLEGAKDWWKGTIRRYTTAWVKRWLSRQRGYS